MKRLTNSPPSHKDDFREKEKVRKENAGKFFYDLAKITFTVVALGGFTALFTEANNIKSWQTLLVGLVFTITLGLYANRLLKK